MKGWQLFQHSVTMISRDIAAAFRVTGLPYAIIVVVSFFFPAFFGVDPQATMSFSPLFLVAIAAYFAASLWLAVQWHRYVLTGEIQSGIVPHWHGEKNLAYFLRSLLLILIAIPIFLVIFIPAGLLSAVFQSVGAAILLNAVAAAFALAVLGRFSPVLPAAALGESLSFSEAWQATRGATGAILVMSILVSLLSVLPSILFAIGLGFIAVVANLAFQWLVTVLTVSVMTTLYGHYVEGRELT